MRWVTLALIIVLILFSACLSSTLTPDKTIKNSAELSGTTVTITGTLEKWKCAMTTGMCLDNDPCCNTVSCNLAFVGETGAIILENKKCDGNNCEVTCDIEPGQVTLTGIFKASEEEYLLEVI
jgi:hypothetical protein|tara:strand:- start:738 stop:1106 length:369 start_codon:yes stop_codon:yes gene_type:complete